MKKQPTGDRPTSGNTQRREIGAGGHWPAASVVMRPVAKLTPYANNARTHSPEQIKQIAESMKRWGFSNPVLVDEKGMILAGHGRVLAAKLIGFTEVPVMIAEGWSDDEKSAYVLADNKIAANAGWDADKIAAEVKKLWGNSFDVMLTGSTKEEIESLTEFAGPSGVKWDADKIAAEVKKLWGNSFDVTLSGFSKEEIESLKVQTTEVKDQFWISIRGPLAKQAEALRIVKEIGKALEGVTVDIGVISLEE